MAEKKENKNNVKAIRKDISIEEKVLTPIPEIVDALEKLLAHAKSGNLRELCYTAMHDDETYAVNIVGEAIDFPMTNSLLQVLKDNYYEAITWPNITGFFDDLE